MMGKTSLKPEQASDDAEKRRRDRARYWARKLGRLRLGVESIDDQLAKYRRVTWALTVVPSIIAVFFISLFSVFGRPDIGLILVAILLAPIVAFAWLDYALLARNARRYRAEQAAQVTDWN
jgi:threonine/homoserine/homoserine lactone efflux protein